MTPPPPKTAGALGARSAALDALDRILASRRPLEPALAESRGYRNLSPRDRAFARLLVATVLRRRGEIDALIGMFLDRPLPRSAARVNMILALGIAQIAFLETPAHAAVDTAVRLAAKEGRGRYRGLVNAVLRRMVRDGKALAAGLDGPALDMPAWLRRICEAAYGAENTRRIAEAHMKEPPLDLSLRDPGEAEKWADLLDARMLPTGSLRRAAGGLIEALPGYDEGAWWVQDAAAALPVRLFPELRGRRILDLCAAPGGKTLQLAAAGAEVTALDLSPERLERVADNLRRTGLSAALVAADGRDYDPGTAFDGVLLDAPCSATGTVRRHPDIPHTKSEDDANKLTPLQDALLDRAAELTRPGGTLVYAVCSLDPREGEERVASFLARRPHFRLDPADPAVFGGSPEWVTGGGTLRTQPFDMGESGGMDGFFAARLQRPGEAAR